MKLKINYLIFHYLYEFSKNNQIFEIYFSFVKNIKKKMFNKLKNEINIQNIEIDNKLKDNVKKINII